LAEKLHIDPKIKEGIKLVKEVLLYIISYWYLLVIFVVLAFVIGKILKKPAEVTYQADLTFTINHQNMGNSNSSNAANLISEFGLGGGGLGGEGASSTIRFIELSQSNTVLAAVLFRKYKIENRVDYLANHYLNIYDESKEIQDSSFFKDFRGMDSLTRAENAKLKDIINKIKRDNLKFTVSPATIFKISTTSINEPFTKALAESFYKAHSELYTEGATAKAKATYDFSLKRYEEVRAKLRSSEYALAAYVDGNHGRTMQRAYLTEIDLERTVQINEGVYFEALRALEAAKIALDNQRPIFQMVDPPLYPLNKKVSSPGKVSLFAQLGAFAFFLFITLSLYFYKKYSYLIKDLFKE
jgi:uncharacterized protein involved in exopolysaccharide biosynthesis